ncbi:MAG: hypothetical protein ACC656_11380, partial [Candidatus Heimdallarchaeota archaeon]
NNYVARSSNLQDPLYLGIIDEYRISGIVLNPAQVAARNVPIIENDVTYNDLVYYWDLLDEVSLIQEKIQDKDGIFIGGLFTDETLSLIYNPNQILFDQNEQYLYILSQELDHDLQEPFDYDEELLDNEDIEIFDNEDDNIIGFENPPTFASAIFRIDLRTEDVDLITEMDNIQSMYVKDNQLFWLTYHNIYQENDIQPVVENVLGAVDFCVVFDKIFYVDREYKIFDENKTLVFEITFSGLLSISTFQTTNSKIDLFYGFYQTNSDNWYNVYVKNYDGRIFILSSQFISSSDTLQLKGIYPFYLTDFPNAKKGVSLNGKDYYITTENRVVEVVNENIAIDLDPLNRYWNWNVATLFGINGYDKYLFIGSINLQQEVQVWRYDTETRQHLLLRKINRTVFFDSTNPLLDLDLTN